MTQLVVASTLFGAATAAAAVDGGLLPAGGERVLLVANNAPAPELTPALDQIPGAEAVLSRFDRVVHLTDLLAPVHPSDWTPDPRERPMLEKLLRQYWKLGDGELSIACESVWVPPAQSLALIFRQAPVTVYADGLMSYGPTRSPLPLEIVERLQGLLHLDLVPALRPVLFSEYGTESRVIPNEHFRALLAEIALAARSGALIAPERPHAVIVGQYLSALGILSRQEEAELHAQMVREAAARGAEVVRFKPHPSAPPGLMQPVHQAAEQCGVTLEVITDALPVETMLARGPVALIGCFSTALATARSVLGVPTATVGTPGVLRRLRPFENSNRVPLTIIDALHREGGAFATPARLQALVEAVAYVMQPESLAALRPSAEAVLQVMTAADRRRYFDAARLDRLSLPGGEDQPRFRRRLTQVARWARARPLIAGLEERTRGTALRAALVKRYRSGTS